MNDADWSWHELFPFYKSSTSLRIPNRDSGFTYNPEFHGFSGPVNISYPAQGTPAYFDILKKTASTYGIAAIRDFNGGKAEGLSNYPALVTINGQLEQTRESASEAYYLPITGRTNLELLDQTECLRLVFDPAKNKAAPYTATGVDISGPDNTTTVNVNKEVIISAGVYRSPGILEYSGIGNPKLMANFSIESRIDLPGVGENLQDQMQGNFEFERVNNTNITFPDPAQGITTPYLIHATYEQIFGTDAVNFLERMNKSLPQFAALNSQKINGVLSADQILKSLQVQYDIVFSTVVPAVEIFSGQSLGDTHLNLEFWPLIPWSRGNVHISGGNAERASDAPTIDVHWGLLEYDWEIFIAAGRFVRNFFATPPLSGEVTIENSPNTTSIPVDASDAEWRDYWSDNFRAGWHGVGTCAMLPREWGGVVNGDLKVYDTDNVRVVDASVIPFQLGGHPTSTIYALAERAASLILEGKRG